MPDQRAPLILEASAQVIPLKAAQVLLIVARPIFFKKRRARRSRLPAARFLRASHVLYINLAAQVAHERLRFGTARLGFVPLCFRLGSLCFGLGALGVRFDAAGFGFRALRSARRLAVARWAEYHSDPVTSDTTAVVDTAVSAAAVGRRRIHFTMRPTTLSGWRRGRLAGQEAPQVSRQLVRACIAARLAIFPGI